MPATTQSGRNLTDSLHWPSNHQSAAEPMPPSKTYFTFHLRDGATDKGLPGAVFELLSYYGSGRHVAISNRHGRVCFSVVIGELYILVETKPPCGYSINPEMYKVRMEENALTINGAAESSFVVFNHHHRRPYSIVYRADDPSSESLRFELSRGTRHAVINERRAGFQKAGHAFFAWNTSPSGKGTLYLPGDMLTVNDDIHLYAQWVPMPSQAWRTNAEKSLE